MRKEMILGTVINRKTQLSFLQKLTSLKFIWKYRGTKIAKTVLKKKNKVRGLILSDFKMYYKLQ